MAEMIERKQTTPNSVKLLCFCNIVLSCIIFYLLGLFSVLNRALPTLQNPHSPSILMLHAYLNEWATIITIVLCVTHQALWSDCGKLLSSTSCQGLSEGTITPEKESVWEYYLWSVCHKYIWHRHACIEWGCDEVSYPQAPCINTCIQPRDKIKECRVHDCLIVLCCHDQGGINKELIYYTAITAEVLQPW